MNILPFSSLLNQALGKIPSCPCQGPCKGPFFAPVIDLHVHVAGIGVGSNCRISPGLLKNWRYGIYLKAFGTTEAELGKQGDGLIFEKIHRRLQASRLVDGAVLLALDQVYDPTSGQPLPEATEVYIPNDFIIEGAAPFPGLFFGASINPYRADWEPELERVRNRGAVLIKWLPAIQRIDPSDPVLVPFYRRLAAVGLPLLVHTGAERSFSRNRDNLGDPHLLNLPLEQGVTVIAAHVATTGRTGGQSHVDRLLQMLREFPRLFTDISSLTQLNKLSYPGRIVDHVDIHAKLLYGSDFPLISAGIGPFRLVSPWNFFWKLPWRLLRELGRIPNDWDRDLLLKRALGFPDSCFARPAELLGLTGKRGFPGSSGGRSFPFSACGSESTLSSPPPASGKRSCEGRGFC
jgi:hypothetical protein